MSGSEKVEAQAAKVMGIPPLVEAYAAYRHRLLLDGDAFALLGVPSKVLDPSRVSFNYLGRSGGR